MIPKDVLKRARIPFNYQAEPTISIPIGWHRNGQSGGGGGVSSTGSSETAKGWSERLAQAIPDAKDDEPPDVYTALQMTINDEINAMMVGMMDGKTPIDPALGTALFTVIDSHAALGRLEQKQQQGQTGDPMDRVADLKNMVADLKNMVADRIFRLLELEESLARGKKGPPAVP